jgi:alpha-ketoglutaric semialdehyde dehydrogenase
MFRSENPARPSEIVGEFPRSSAADAVAAVEAAAVAQRDWAARPARHRAVVIGGVAHALAKETRELAGLITREEGKTLAEAEAEVHKAVEQFHFAAQICYLSEGATYPDEQPGVLAYTLRSPLGVVVAVTPWNFPVSLPARKLGPALAAGNAVVFKPSPVTAAVGDLLVRIIRDAGVPRDVVRIVQGDDPDAMTALVGHPEVRAVSFTGSSRVGEIVRARMHRHARLQAELSGDNVAVVCADADLERAAQEVTGGAFGLTGQACTAAARVLVERPAYEALRDLVAERVAKIVCGPGDAPGTTCGPLATRGQLTRVTELLRAAGEVVATGALAPDRDPDGYYLAPALLGGLPPGEVFGPLLAVSPVGSVDEAIRIINAGDHGLAAAVHTGSLATAQGFARSVRCGIIKINQRTTGNGIAPPFGGWKSSSAGAFPEGGLQALDFFTDVKSVYSRV